MPYFYGIKSSLERIAIELPNIPGVESVPPDKVHITILYIGSHRPKGNVLRAIDARLRQVRPFRVTIGPEVDLFPSLSKPRALVLKISEGISTLLKVRSLLLSTLQEYGVKIEDKYIHNFTPHVTVGWIRTKLDFASAVELLDEIRALLKTVKISLVVDKIDLVDSTGGSYKVLYAHCLG